MVVAFDPVGADGHLHLPALEPARRLHALEIEVESETGLRLFHLVDADDAGRHHYRTNPENLPHSESDKQSAGIGICAGSVRPAYLYLDLEECLRFGTR